MLIEKLFSNRIIRNEIVITKEFCKYNLNLLFTDDIIFHRELINHFLCLMNIIFNLSIIDIYIYTFI